MEPWRLQRGVWVLVPVLGEALGDTDAGSGIVSFCSLTAESSLTVVAAGEQLVDRHRGQVRADGDPDKDGPW